MKGLDEKKVPGSVDDILDQRLNVFIDVLNTKIEDIYKNFNLAMQAKSIEMTRIENQLTNMVNVMWGLTNEQRIRLLTLEDHVLKHNIGTPDELQDQYLDNIAKFKEASGFEEIPIEDLVNSGINPLDTVGNLSVQRQDLNPDKPF